MRVSSKSVGLLLFFATIVLLIVPVAYTTPPTEGSGTFDMSIPDVFPPDIRFAGKNMIVHAWGGGGELFGIFKGTWIHDERAVVHPSGMVTLNGVWDTPDGVTFNGLGGTLEDTVHVRYSATVSVTGVMHGRFVIISGTGELENLRGQGTILFDPAIDPVLVYYTIRYHFDPS